MIRLRTLKRLLSLFFILPGVFRFCLLIHRVFYGVAYVRIINYHGTPASYLEQFERQLQFYAQHYSNTTIDDIENLLSRGEWNHRRPGLMLTFDDGLRSHYKYALPLLESYGFSGCFMVPAALVANQHDRAKVPEYASRIHADEKWPDARHMISVEELRKIRPPHLLVGHTLNHVRMWPDLSESIIHNEIVDAKRSLEKLSGGSITSFCWVGGEPSNYNPIAMRKIQEAGYRYSFMTCSGVTTAKTHPLQLHRTNIEASAPLSYAKFQISGLMDWFHLRRRRYVNRLTCAELGNTVDSL